jgi:hypothetical protein
MAYGAILTVAAVVLAVRYAFRSEASVGSRATVALTVIGSFLIPWRIIAILMQFAVCMFVLLYLKVADIGRR